MTNDQTASTTSLGLPENTAGALAYVLGWITGIIFLLLEQKSDYVRFHAMQSTVTFLALMLVSWLLAWIPILGALISVLLFPVSLVLWLFLIYKAYQGERYHLPVIGDFAEDQLSKFPKKS